MNRFTELNILAVGNVLGAAEEFNKGSFEEITAIAGQGFS